MITRRTWILLALGILVLAGEWAVLRAFYSRSPLASIECRATNAGVALTPGAVSVAVYPTGRPWQLAAAGKLQEPLRVPPGHYDVRLLLTESADQQSQWLRGLVVDEGSAVIEHVDFAAGELRVVSSQSRGTKAGRVIVYVFRSNDHDDIVTSLRPAETALLAAGAYDLRAVLTFGSEERGVVWLENVHVEPGGLVTPEVRFQRGTLLVNARNAGEELASEAVTLTVFAAGDEQQEVVDSGRAGVPLSLEPGRYDVELSFARSNDEPQRWLRGIEIGEGERLTETVDFRSGRIRVDAKLVDGEPLGDFDVYVYYYHVGDHREPVTYTQAGQVAVLESGAYDVRVHFFRSHDRPDAWFPGIAVEPGVEVEYTATFRSGRLIVRAYDGDRRELIGDDVFLYVHEAGASSSRAIVVARTGEELILTEGVYDVRLLDTRTGKPVTWLRGIVLEPGGRIEHAVRLESAAATGSKAPPPPIAPPTARAKTSTRTLD